MKKLKIAQKSNKSMYVQAITDKSNKIKSKILFANLSKIFSKPYTKEIFLLLNNR